MAKYRIALIGTGRVGYQFSFGDLPDNHAEAIAQTDRCELVAGVNRGREKLHAFGERFGITALYHDYREMLEAVQPDICIIATHPELHCEMVSECAEAESVKAIICEKPMALSLDECDRMIEACDRAGVLLHINHNRRWNAEWNLALRLVREGAIGDLVHISCHMDGGKPAPWWRSENEGPLLHDFTHYFDMMDMFAGELDWLCGMAEQRSRPWAVEDFSAAFIRFRNGVTGALHASELTEYTSNAFELRGSTGMIHLVGEKVHLYQSVEGDYEPESGFQWNDLRAVEVDHPAPVSTYVVALNEFLDALEGKGELRSDGQIGRRSLEVVMAIYQSQLQGSRSVHLPLSDRGSGVEALRASGAFVDRS
ncbi:MAG: Gfo/Idh/MocA family oxidoreductase [Candidatus Latescibacteria bacterium]|jgi:predicted dehydrogenase|nr:Gfo/Idh/MocA family oxidoreductase [Candidatus Latescibacterota bacterium]